ncbi:MAG: glycogen synthase [Acholeplasmataceae bacterium]
MRILFCSSEAFPFSKTGGLADMALFLPKSLLQLDHSVQVITPYYPSVAHYHDQMQFIGYKTIRFGGLETIVNYFELKYQGLSFIFVQNMHYFERDQLYGYSDDAERFACFSYAILEVLPLLEHYPSILHLNDWQTGMVPYLLDEHYRHRNQSYFSIHTLLTIHNLEYQGTFDTYVSRFFNTAFNYTYIHFDRVNFLKAGIERATLINTVSPSYRDEILTQDYGFSLDGALYKRKDDLVGVLNGIDDDVFNPKTDPHIVKTFDLRNVKSAKKSNKAYVLEKFGLSHDLDQPLIVYIGRLANQKGIHLMARILEEVITFSDARFILMGSGDHGYQEYFKQLTETYPDRVGNYIGFSETVAHQLYAASDLFMMPSRFEPCGLGQMIAMTYGSLPIVHETGGLKDTVIPYNRFTKEGTGFSFARYDAHDFKDKIFEAIDLYKNHPEDFYRLVKQAMKEDFSLKQMALSYEKIYQRILGV